MTLTPLEQAVANGEKRPRTKVIYLEAVRSFIKYAGEDPNTWNGFTIENWKRERLSQVAPQTVNLQLAGLRYACKRLSQLTGDARYYSFVQAVERTKPEQSKKRRALDEDQVFSLLQTCKKGRPIDIRDCAIMTVGFRTGLRRDGISNLKFDDIKDKGLTVTLKGGRRHTVYPDALVWEAMNVWSAWLAEQGMRSGYFFRAIGKEKIDGGYTIKDKISPDAIYFAIKKRARECGMRNVSPHIMRHTFVSWCKQKGVPDYRIKAMTGHQSSQMLDLYTTDLEAQSKPIGDILPWLK